MTGANHPFQQRGLNALDENGNEGCAFCGRPRDVHPEPADAATPGQAEREALEATFRREYALHPNDARANFTRALDAVMGAADAYAQAVAQADLLERLRAVLLDLRTNPTEARIQALHLIDADDPAERADVLRMRRRIAAEQPAPGLAAAKPDLGTAWRLLNETREQLALLQDSIGNLAAGLKLSADASRPSKKSQIEDGCAAALLAILDPR